MTNPHKEARMKAIEHTAGQRAAARACAEQLSKYLVARDIDMATAHLFLHRILIHDVLVSFAGEPKNDVQLDDQVARIWTEQAWLSNHEDSADDPIFETQLLLIEAADTITDLRAEIARLRLPLPTPPEGGL